MEKPFENPKNFKKDGDCHIWQGRIDKDGYGAIKDNGKNSTIHQYMYKRFKGEIPERKEVLHTCRVRTCANPKHLYLGTHKENMRDVSLHNQLQKLKDGEPTTKDFVRLIDELRNKVLLWVK